MKRNEKLNALSRLLQGAVNHKALDRILNPVPNSINGVAIVQGTAELGPNDPVSATLLFAGGRSQHRSLTYQEYRQIAALTPGTLFVLPNNHRDE